MVFRTEIRLLPGQNGLISHHRPVLLLGSCFSDNIGRELSEDLFDTVVNPFGPLYNPLSILRGLEMSTRENMPIRLCRVDEKFMTFDAHSKIWGQDEETLRGNLLKAVGRLRVCLAGNPIVIVTLGTTRIFTLISDDTVVSNCHKQSGRLFRESTLTLPETIDALERIVSRIRSFSPESDIIFTVSPLRYPSADPHANTVSKSILHLAVDDIVSRSDRLHYFPAYEIMMDDLRDYRFYADDMRHPSGMAVGYIYEKFSESYFDEETCKVARSARRLTRRLNHRSETQSDPVLWPESEVLRSYPYLVNIFNRFVKDEI